MNFFFRVIPVRPWLFLGKYRDRRAEAITVPCGKDSSPSRKVLQYSPKKTGVLPEEDWKRISNYPLFSANLFECTIKWQSNPPTTNKYHLHNSPKNRKKSACPNPYISGSSHADHHSKIKSNQICQTALNLQLQDQLAKKRIGPSEPGTSIF